MKQQYWPHPLIKFVLRLDRGSQARLRRGTDPSELLLLAGLARLVAGRSGEELAHSLLTAQIAAILGSDGTTHPGAALAKARLHDRRMGRLLTSEVDVLPGRLLVVARFLAAKQVSAAVAPFYWLLREVDIGVEIRTRTEWARRFGEIQSGAVTVGSRNKTL